MRVRVRSVVLDVTDLSRAAEFWCDALGYRLRDRTEEWADLIDPRGERVEVGLRETPHRAVHGGTVQIDLAAENVPNEVKRLEFLGATRVPWESPEPAECVVLADPDGNEFCVVPAA